MGTALTTSPVDWEDETNLPHGSAPVCRRMALAEAKEHWGGSGVGGDERGPGWDLFVFVYRAVWHRSASQLPSKGAWSQPQSRLCSAPNPTPPPSSSFSWDSLTPGTPEHLSPPVSAAGDRKQLRFLCLWAFATRLTPVP